MSDKPPPPSGISALLLVTAGCAHCAAIKIILNRLMQQGLLADVKIVDVSKQPELARQYNVKSVPWLKLGPVVLRGAQSESELRQWLAQLDPGKPASALLEHMLQTDALDQVVTLIKQQPAMLVDLVPLVVDEELEFKTRLGVSAVIESFEGTAVLRSLVQPLKALAEHESPRIRADVAHFLGLMHNPDVEPVLQQLARDADREVREIARDGLAG